MNDYLTRQLIADRQASIAADMKRGAQVRAALAARRARPGVLRFAVGRAPFGTLAGLFSARRAADSATVLS